LEIGSEIESHAAYLGHWIEMLKAEPTCSFQVAGEARQAVDLIYPEAHGRRSLSALSEPHRQVKGGTSRQKCPFDASGLAAQNDLSPALAKHSAFT